MASSIHMSHSLFFVFIKNEEIALLSDISNELRHTCLRQRLSAEMKNAPKLSLMPATVCVMKKSKIFYALLYVFCRLSPCLSLDVCLQSTVHLRSGVSYYERLIFDISNGH